MIYWNGDKWQKQGETKLSFFSDSFVSETVINIEIGKYMFMHALNYYEPAEVK